MALVLSGILVIVEDTRSALVHTRMLMMRRVPVVFAAGLPPVALKSRHTQWMWLHYFVCCHTRSEMCFLNAIIMRSPFSRRHPCEFDLIEARLFNLVEFFGSPAPVAARSDIPRISAIRCPAGLAEFAVATLVLWMRPCADCWSRCVGPQCDHSFCRCAGVSDLTKDARFLRREHAPFPSLALRALSGIRPKNCGLLRSIVHLRCQFCEQ